MSLCELCHPVAHRRRYRLRRRHRRSSRHTALLVRRRDATVVLRRRHAPRGRGTVPLACYNLQLSRYNLYNYNLRPVCRDTAASRRSAELGGRSRDPARRSSFVRRNGDDDDDSCSGVVGRKRGTSVGLPIIIRRGVSRESRLCAVAFPSCSVVGGTRKSSTYAANFSAARLAARDVTSDPRRITRVRARRLIPGSLDHRLLVSEL